MYHILVFTPFKDEVHAASLLPLNSLHESDVIKQAPSDQKQTVEKEKKRKKEKKKVKWKEKGKENEMKRGLQTLIISSVDAIAGIFACFLR
jgi:hypothetical protein